MSITVSNPHIPFAHHSMWGHHAAYERQEEREHYGYCGYREYRVDHGDACHLGYQTVPVAFRCGGWMREGDIVQSPDPRLGQPALKHPVARHGEAYHVGGEEGGYHRYCHHNRIEKFARHLERKSQRSYDEREFTYLCHGESASHGRLKRLSAYEESERAEHGLTHKYRKHEGGYRHSILDDDFRVYQHAHRHEKDGSEEVFHRGYKLLYLACLDGFGEYAAHDKGSEG